MRRILSAVAAAVMAAGLIAPASAHAAAVEDPAVCPEVAVVAARGSEENVELGPTRYSAESPWTSNGYEGYQIGTFLHFAEARHLELHGEPLLENVPVIALDPTVYPAAFTLPALAEEGEELAALDVVLRVNTLLNHDSAAELAQTAMSSLADSLHSGITGTTDYLAGWEAATGCSPQYILVGFSQGSVVLTAQERELASQGRLAGVVYLGNPWVKPNEPTMVGGATPGGGMLRYAPAEWQRTAGDVPRVNYCLPRDLACDTSLSSGLGAAQDAASTGGLGAHTDYFTGEAPAEHDAYVADVFASWIHAAENR